MKRVIFIRREVFYLLMENVAPASLGRRQREHVRHVRLLATLFDVELGGEATLKKLSLFTYFVEDHTLSMFNSVEPLNHHVINNFIMNTRENTGDAHGEKRCLALDLIAACLKCILQHFIPELTRTRLAIVTGTR